MRKRKRQFALPSETGSLDRLPCITQIPDSPCDLMIRQFLACRTQMSKCLFNIQVTFKPEAAACPPSLRCLCDLPRSSLSFAHLWTAAFDDRPRLSTAQVCDKPRSIVQPAGHREPVTLCLTVPVSSIADLGMRISLCQGNCCFLIGCDSRLIRKRDAAPRRQFGQPRPNLETAPNCATRDGSAAWPQPSGSLVQWMPPLISIPNRACLDAESMDGQKLPPHLFP